MATQLITMESTTMTETESIILMRTAKGTIPVEYSDQETIGNLKRRLKTSHSYSIASQQLLFSGGLPGDPTEEVGDDRLVRDVARRPGTLRLNIRPTSATANDIASGSESGRNEQVSGNNTIRDLDMDQTGRANVGQWHSEIALASGSGNIRGAINKVGSARITGNAGLRVGDKFGGIDPDAPA
ncbi:hypothetical protein FOCG_09487 [Fusarium oxysporum f. sp. radicis-lycopersici 26381]|nr:hypothetical protein FOCG_09487 [Fusarium oxysporum f. sp. radicis-lycopersici 26381]